MANLILPLAKNPEKQFTIRELSLNLNKSYSTTYRRIKELNNRNLKLQKIGASETITLIPSESTILKLSTESDEEKNQFLSKNPLIKKIYQEILQNYKGCVLVFGSYAKKANKKNSDLDIIIINSSGNKDLDFLKYETILNLEINPMFFSFDEFQEMLTDEPENVGKQALKNNILLVGHYKFWSTILNGKTHL